jgi:hypothetical protein
LDTALAHGADPCQSPALACRAALLTSRPSREQLADWLERTRLSGLEPHSRPSVKVEADREALRCASASLDQVQELLRSSRPLYAQGVAMIASVLKDGGSSLYLPMWKNELDLELQLAIAALEGRSERFQRC